MGLAAPRKRRKLAQDPNNTAWTRNSDTYGQRILAAQGWTPGNFLGAESAPHAGHYTAGSAGHVRVSLKDDNLGLGASRSHEAETTGLGNFQDLLGRLNGKEEVQIDSERQARKALGTKQYAQHRWGITRFVRAGYLVGDRVEAFPPENTIEDSGSENPYSSITSDVTTRLHSDRTATSEESEREAEKRRHKEEKRRRKEERRKARDQRRLRKEAKDHTVSSADDAGGKTEQSVSVPQRHTASSKSSEGGVTALDASTPAPSGPQSRPISSKTARGNVRQRYLMQKRKAAMDPQAMREILMIKSSG